MNAKEEELEYGKNLYRKLAELVSKEIYKPHASPIFTIRAMALCMTRIAVGIVGYQKANELIAKAINEAMATAEKDEKRLRGEL